MLNIPSKRTIPSVIWITHWGSKAKDKAWMGSSMGCLDHQCNNLNLEKTIEIQLVQFTIEFLR